MTRGERTERAERMPGNPGRYRGFLCALCKSRPFVFLSCFLVVLAPAFPPVRPLSTLLRLASAFSWDAQRENVREQSEGKGTLEGAPVSSLTPLFFSLFFFSSLHLAVSRKNKNGSGTCALSLSRPGHEVSTGGRGKKGEREKKLGGASPRPPFPRGQEKERARERAGT